MEQASAYQKEHTLLLVDDEPAVLRSLSRALNQCPYKVLVANSAKQAKELMASYDVQVLLSDYQMPDVDGGELLKQVKQEHPDTIAMILSGYADFSNAQEVINSGTAFRFLSKPWDNGELIRHIEQAFSEYDRLHDNFDTTQAATAYTQTLLEPNAILAASLKHVVTAELNALLKSQQDFYVIQIQIDNFSYLKSKCDIHLAELLQCQLTAYGHEGFCEECKCLYAGDGGFYLVGKKRGLKRKLESAISSLYARLDMPFHTVDETFNIYCKLAYLEVTEPEKHTPETIIQSLLSVQNDTSYPHDSALQVGSEHLEALQRQKTICDSIQPAIEQNGFELYFQPKISLRNRKIESAEILLRWNHQELGWIPPEEFIKLSELDKQIDAIWQWMSRASFAAIKRLFEMHPVLDRISINISAGQLTSGSLVDELRMLLEEHDLSAECIELEITETSVVDNIETCQQTILALKKLGFLLSIDDFGSGYSSLAYIAKLPIDVVKLDKILIDDISHSSANRALVGHILQMTYSLGIKTVVEGVEDSKQLAILEQMPCDSIQGFLFSPAVDFDTFNQLCFEQPFAE
ncbi:EAL domain-containing response regulator [Alteromonadaceae bacterium M269]|nr:EAL domain-containing response regulator [Alteromonadaceae bacterium M269]